jgi:hypothetical protein
MLLHSDIVPEMKDGVTRGDPAASILVNSSRYFRSVGFAGLVALRSAPG